MKTKLLFIIVLIPMLSFCQSDTSKSRFKISPYICVGLSMSNGDDFNLNSYPSLETGIMKDNLCIGFVMGRGNLDGIGEKGDHIQNYYCEIKPSVNFEIGMLTGNLLFGCGSYVGTKHHFIEYGIGVWYSIKKLSYGVTYSNWDNCNYVTPGITFNF